jgi:hypothetical protein
MQRNGIVVLASVALAAVAIIVAAYMFTQEPQPEPLSAGEKFIQQAHEERVTCLEGGGTWVRDPFVGSGTCGHSSVEPAAPAVEAPSTSDGENAQGLPSGSPKYAYEQFWRDDWMNEAPSFYGISSSEAKCALRWLQDHVPFGEANGNVAAASDAVETCK